MQWNCRAVKRNAAQLIQHVSHVDYEILSLQSLHCRPGDLPSLEGYYYPPVAPDGRVMVCIYIKLSVQASEVAETSGPPNGYSCAVRVRVLCSFVLFLLNVLRCQKHIRDNGSE